MSRQIHWVILPSLLENLDEVNAGLVSREVYMSVLCEMYV